MKTKRRSPIKTEAEVAREVDDALALFGIDCPRQNTGGMVNPRGQYVAFGRPGAADRAGQLPDGRHLALEIKRPGKKPTPQQWDKIHRVNAQNGVAFYIDDGAELARILPLLLAGCRIEIDENGNQFVTDEERRES